MLDYITFRSHYAQVKVEQMEYLQKLHPAKGKEAIEGEGRWGSGGETDTNQEWVNECCVEMSPLTSGTYRG